MELIAGTRIIEKNFQNRTTKKAYLECCKWLSTNIIAVNNSGHLAYRIEKVRDDSMLCTVRLTVYVVEEEEKIQERHCDICREVTGSFFMKQNKYMCETCKMKPYRERVKKRLEALKESLKGVIL